MIDWHQLEATVPQLEAETDALFPDILDRGSPCCPACRNCSRHWNRRGFPRRSRTSSRRSFVIDVLSRFDLVPRFAFLLTSEDVTHGKPDPEIYVTACQRLSCPPQQVMVLEDSENGCRAAVAAGTYAVAVPGFHSRNHSFTGTRFIAQSLADPRIYQAMGLPAEQR